MIPIVVTPPVQPPSPQAEELADLLTLSIQEFQQRRPETNAVDIQTALRLTSTRTVASGPRATAAIAVALLLAGVLAALIVLFLVKKGQPQSMVMPIALGVGVLGAIVGILAIAKARG